MKVVHLIKGIPTISEVPDNWVECSVLREFRAPEEFHNAEGIRCRTNCHETYVMDNMRELADKNKLVIEGREYKEMLDQFCTKNAYFNESITVYDMIEALRKLDYHSRLIVTHEGFYASGKLAEIFEPNLEREIDGTKFYSIGHSSQNY